MPRPFYADAAVSIWQGDALNLPFPNQSVDLIVTSPPYFALRSYTDAGEHYDGQVGSEATPREYVDALVAATAEMVRVLKPAGSIWVNLGDKYAQDSERSRNGEGARRDPRNVTSSYLGGTVELPARDNGVPRKSLLGLPWRYALRVVDELGLILRRDQIWNKPNGLPESVTDRTRSSHEYLFHFVKQPTYYSAVDEIREEHSGPWKSPGSGDATKAFGPLDRGGKSQWERTREDRDATVRHPLGKLPGSVWTIPTQPLRVPWGYGVEAGRVARYFTDERDALGWLRLSHRGQRRRIRRLPDHFAAFPLELPRRIIRGWSPTGICVACGEGRRPVVAATPEWTDFRERHGMGSWADHTQDATHGNRNTYKHGLSGAEIAAFGPKKALTGYACACDAPTAPTRPAVVLDPFGGTCTTALVARAEGRIGWAVDLSADYCRLGRWRVTDPGERARALQVAKPPPVPAGSDALFDLEGA